MLTPSEIKGKEFEKGRNYTREVRQFLAKVAAEYEVIYTKNSELTDKIQRLESLVENYSQIEDSMKNALLLAQKTADSTIAAANKEAENILLNAKIAADKLNIETIDKNNRIKIANKTLYARFEAYKKLCMGVIKQHSDLIDSIEVSFKAEDLDVDIDDINYDAEVMNDEFSDAGRARANIENKEEEKSNSDQPNEANNNDDENVDDHFDDEYFDDEYYDELDYDEEFDDYDELDYDDHFDDEYYDDEYYDELDYDEEFDDYDEFQDNHKVNEKHKNTK